MKLLTYIYSERAASNVICLLTDNQQTDSVKLTRRVDATWWSLHDLLLSQGQPMI